MPLRLGRRRAEDTCHCDRKVRLRNILGVRGSDYIVVLSVQSVVYRLYIRIKREQTCVNIQILEYFEELGI